MNTKAEKWARIFRAEGGQWPEDGHWPEQWYAIEREMERSGDIASSGGGGYEDKKNESGDLGTPYVFIDNSGLLLSGGDDKAFPAIRLFSEAEIAGLQGVWDRAAAIVFEGREIAWLEKHVAKAEVAKTKHSRMVEGISVAKITYTEKQKAELQKRDLGENEGWVFGHFKDNPLRPIRHQAYTEEQRKILKEQGIGEDEGWEFGHYEDDPFLMSRHSTWGEFMNDNRKARLKKEQSQAKK